MNKWMNIQAEQGRRVPKKTQEWRKSQGAISRGLKELKWESPVQKTHERKGGVVTSHSFINLLNILF